VSSEIRTERLVLRPFRAEDLDVWHRTVFADPEVMRYLPGGVPLPRERLDGSLERGLAHWELRRYGLWAVRDLGGGELLGHCGLRYLDEVAQTELLYAFGRSSWGRGIATEAARASLRFGFDEAGLERVIALAVPENVASRRVMEHIGMALEGEEDLFGLHCVKYGIERSAFDPGDAVYELRSA
jgi:RimJ/RimL family protein N-acetyltransferase